MDFMKKAGASVAKAAGAAAAKELMTSEMLSGIFAKFATGSGGSGGGSFLNFDGLKGAAGAAMGTAGKALEWGSSKTEDETKKVVERAESSLPDTSKISLDQFTKLMQQD